MDNFHYQKLIKRKVVWIVIITSLCMGITTMVSLWYLPSNYASSITMIAYANTDENNDIYANLKTGLELKNDVVNMVAISSVLQELKTRLSITIPESPYYSTENLSKRISVLPTPNSRIFKISYTDTSPQSAQIIANMIGEVLAGKVKALIGTDLLILLDSANLPAKKSSPNIPTNILIAAIFGIFSSVIVFVGYDYVKNL